jgi:hypothetical protein
MEPRGQQDQVGKKICIKHLNFRWMLIENSSKIAFVQFYDIHLSFYSLAAKFLSLHFEIDLSTFSDIFHESAVLNGYIHGIHFI